MKLIDKIKYWVAEDLLEELEETLTSKWNVKEQELLSIIKKHENSVTLPKEDLRDFIALKIKELDTDKVPVYTVLTQPKLTLNKSYSHDVVEVRADIRLGCQLMGKELSVTESCRELAVYIANAASEKIKQKILADSGWRPVLRNNEGDIYETT